MSARARKFAHHLPALRVAIALFFAGGSVAILFSVFSRRAQLDAAGPIRDTVEAARLEGLEIAESVTEQNRDVTISSLETLIRERLRRAHFPDEPGPLARLAAERFALYSSPSFDAYTHQVEELRDNTGAAPGRASGLSGKDAWLRLARSFARARYAFGDVRVRMGRTSDPPTAAGMGGRVHTVTDEGIYSSRPGAVEPACVLEVPITLFFNKNDRKVNVLFTTIYRKRSRDGVWVPFQASVFDPGVDAPFLPTPWL